MRTLVCLLLLVVGQEAAAEELRIALLVAHPLGGDDLTPLRYTANDVERVREVLQLLGGFDPKNIMVSFGEDADEVAQHFTTIREKIQYHNLNSTDPSLFVFYYSGHAKDGTLRLGDSQLALTEVKDLTEKTQANLRVALLDACRSGSITRLKGAQKGEPLPIEVDDHVEQSGQVLITASSEHEDAQESDEIQGSFFTHFLTSGLRGMADTNQDQAVTLAEAYAYAYGNTVARTVATKGGIQHPTYRFDLRGAGDVVVTRTEKPPSSIAFGQSLAGRFLIFDRERKVIVAEFEKSSGDVVVVPVGPGNYVVKKRETDHVMLQKIRVARAEMAQVDPSVMQKVSFADDYAKGAMVTSEEIKFGRIGVKLSTGIVTQTFLSSPARDDYFPNVTGFQVAFDLDNLLRKYWGLRFDMSLSGSGERKLQLNDPYVGDLNYRVSVSQVTTGIGLITNWPLTERISAGALARLGFILLNRRFVGIEIPNQSFSTMTPGVGAHLSVRIFDWLSAGIQARVHYMFFNVDRSQSLAYIDGGAALTAVFR